MTRDQVRTACAKYAARLGARGCVPVRNIDEKTLDGRLNHIRWMCDEVPRMLEEKQPFETDSSRARLEKAMRWLGFMQGAMAVADVMTIDEMKDDNR
jgi:hypothetical protein